MTDEKQTVRLVPETVRPAVRPIEERCIVTAVLGLVAVTHAGLNPLKGAANSTRWIIDVEDGQDEILFQLLEHRSGRVINPDIIVPLFIPRSASFYDAKPFVSDINGGAFAIRHGAPCSYRIEVDALHTATR